jgi:hypothetical protein
MTSPIWASRFGISDREIADLKIQLADQDDPLRWILAKGYIPTNDYIRWAMDQYSLPSVNDDYFSVPVDQVYWEAVKNEFAWTSAFFPLAEWQGVMLIGCVEPPNFHFPLHTPHRFVIASAHALEHRYRELEPSHIHDQPETHAGYEVPLAEAVIDLANDDADHDFSPAAQHQVSQHVSVRQRPADEVLADELPAAPDVDLHDPEGLVVDIDESSNVNLFKVPEGMTVDSIGKPVPTTPDGLEPQSGMIDMDSLDFSDSGKSVLAPTPPRAPIVPPGPPSAVLQAQASTTLMNSDKVAATMPPPVPDIPRANVSMSEPVIPLATCATMDSLSTSVVAHVNMHFEHALLLMYNQAVLRPTKWSELLFSVKGDHADAISLNGPSIFRIAARTSLPYHGYVVANPTNTEFFNAFNRGVLPKHVTVMPVMIAGQLSGMLMGISMNDVDYKGSLSAMEKIASDFSTQLERVRLKKAA